MIFLVHTDDKKKYCAEAVRQNSVVGSIVGFDIFHCTTNLQNFKNELQATFSLRICHEFIYTIEIM